MEREYKDYITDIVEAIESIERFVTGLTFKNFKKDDKTISAIVRKLEIIGEAAKNIPASVRNKNKQIPWKKMAGIRDKLIHEYFGVNTKVVWKTIKEDLPKVKPLIKEVLGKMEQEAETR